jgi:hypothetical protein
MNLICREKKLIQRDLLFGKKESFVENRVEAVPVMGLKIKTFVSILEINCQICTNHGIGAARVGDKQSDVVL